MPQALGYSPWVWDNLTRQRTDTGSKDKRDPSQGFIRDQTLSSSGCCSNSFFPTSEDPVTGAIIHTCYGKARLVEQRVSVSLVQCFQEENRTKPVLLLGINILQTHLELKGDKAL